MNMLKKLLAWLKRKDEEIASLKEERDAYMDLMTESVKDANDIQKAYDIQTWKWEQAEKQLAEARAVIHMKQRIIDRQRPKIQKLEVALGVSEEDFNGVLREGNDDRDVFVSVFNSIATILNNAALFTDLPALNNDR